MTMAVPSRARLGDCQSPPIVTGRACRSLGLACRSLGLACRSLGLDFSELAEDPQACGGRTGFTCSSSRMSGRLRRWCGSAVGSPTSW